MAKVEYIEMVYIMKPQWEAEFRVEPDFAKLLIEKQFPCLFPVKVDLLGEGWDNTAYCVNNKYVFRFPRKEIAVEWLETENRILPHIAPFLTLPVPVPIFTGQPSDLFQFPFSGYSILPGKTACRASLNREDRIKMAEPIALFLKSLHNIPLENAVIYGAEPDKIRRLDLSCRIPGLYNYLENLIKKNIIKDSEQVKELVKRTGIEPSEKKTTPVHGDFYVRHILVDEKKEISGIIDWGDIHLGNPAIDISIAHGFLPKEGREIFRKTYGEIDEETWRLSKFRALAMALTLMSYSYDTEDRALQKETRLSLDFLLEDFI